jgi:flagellar biosynthesis/type III secretory pathway protein FliH
MLISERYKAKRFAEGRAEGLEEGRAEGLEQGKAEGLEEGRAEGLEEGKATGKEQERMRWNDWNSRRMAAEARGEKFEEPPPSISGFSSQHWLSGVANRDDLRQYATVLASMRPIAGWRKL